MAPKSKTRRSPSRLSSARPTIVLGAASALLGAGSAHALDPHALPQGPNVVGGAASFRQAGDALTIDQSTSRTVIDWRSFDIGQAARTTFNQPGANAIAVNRVNASADPTRIEGALRANGQVWILNPNGVLFGKTARVDVAGLVASTANIDPARFMAGDTRLSLSGQDRGAVTNEGSITVADNGLAAFVAPSVRNSGTITARVGKVALAAGSTFTLDLAGDQLVEIGLGAGRAVVDQAGRIVDEGGQVTLSARSAGRLVDSVVNMSGVATTGSLRLAGGQIVLDADTVNLAGDLDASGTSGGRLSIAGRTISVAPSASLSADSVAGGDGGAIVSVASVQGDYAGRYSARGGPLGGQGGEVETSGKTVRIADRVFVDTRAPAGAMGGWTIDPDDLTVVASGGAGTITGGINSENATISASTVVTALNTSSVNLQANRSITVNAAIDSSAQGNSNSLNFRDQNADGALTVNLNAPITLGSHQRLTGDANVVNLAAGALIQNANDVARTSGASTVNLAAGLYAPGATLTKSNLTLAGAPGAEIDVDPGSSAVNAITIAGNTSGVTVQGLTIVGEITGSYLTYPFGAGISRGVAVASGATGFSITGNTIRNIRTGIVIDGRNTGGVTNNLIDNTKSAISVQYTDGSGIMITGNRQGAFGAEWGENFHLNGYWDGTTIHANPYPGGAAPTSVQTALLADSAANNGWAVQDQAYTASNRTAVTVSPTGSDSNQGSPRSNLQTVNAGISAVVAGGTVNLLNGTYAVAAGSGNYVYVNKPLTLAGQSESGTIIDARAASTYGLRVSAVDGVSLKNFTLYGATGPGSYGIKAEGTHDLTISNVLSQGAYKSEFDLNGVVNATLDGLTADGAPVAGGPNTNGNGISFTDSQNVALTNSLTRNNLWGGLALYQTNNPTGYPLQETGITVAASNTFTEANPVYAEDASATNDFGTLNISGFNFIVKSPTNPADVYTWLQRTAQNAIDMAASVGPATAYVQGYGSGVTGTNVFTVGVSAGGQALTLNAGSGQVSLGTLGAGTRLGAVAVTGAATLTGATYRADSFNFGGSVRLTASATTLDTGGAGGITVAGSVLGSSNGGQSLTLAAGTGAAGAANGDISLQNVGAPGLALGDLTVSGHDFSAQTVDLAGDFTSRLTGNQVFSSHTLNAGGQVNSTVGGDASGPINAGQSVTVTVGGSLTGAIQGTEIALNAGTLTGATVTASQGASVTAGSVVGSTVAAGQNLAVAAGSVSGSNLSAGQNMNLSAGTVSNATLTAPKVIATASSFKGNVNASDAATISGGDISGAFAGGSFKLIGTSSINATVHATSLAVDTPRGTLNGVWQSLDTGSSGSRVLINSQAAGLNPRQLVVENFALPARSRVLTSGEIVLPAGQVISLLSPAGAGGTPKLIQVQTVQDLGALLSQGYTAIVIDLSASDGNG